jgi:DNA-binding GntR family transcriptional regulator
MRPVTKTDSAFLTLRTEIEEGRIKPGERLRVGELVRRLEMSPTPIREALRLLQAEGVVEHEPHRGTVVAQVSTELVGEVYRMRVALEPVAAELAAERATDAELAEIEAIHERMRRAIERHAGGTDIARLNERWHMAVIRAADSRLLLEFLQRLWSAGSVKSFWQLRHQQDSIEQHAAVVAALLARDPAAAFAAMQEHIEFGARSRIEHLRELEREA